MRDRRFAERIAENQSGLQQTALRNSIWLLKVHAACGVACPIANITVCVPSLYGAAENQLVQLSQSTYVTDRSDELVDGDPNINHALSVQCHCC
jgi:hypothetical protein